MSTTEPTEEELAQLQVDNEALEEERVANTAAAVEAENELARDRASMMEEFE